MAKRRGANKKARTIRRGKLDRVLERKVYRLHVEGKVTERQYFQLFASPQIRFQFPSSYGLSPKRLVEAAKKEMARSNRRVPTDDFDEIWCVFDVDSHNDLEDAISLAINSGIKCAISNPCFELWLVLHVADQTAYVERERIQKRCRELSLIEGKRIEEQVGTTLINGIRDAIFRAKNLGKMHMRAEASMRENPSSTVWRLMESIIQFAER